jgi:hypothetical protein
MPAAILSNMLRAATSLTPCQHVCLRAMTKRRPAKGRAYSQFCSRSPQWTLLRPASFLTCGFLI